MFKGAKKKLGSEEKDILIMPSTKNLSAVINKLGLLIFVAFVIVAGYLTGLGIFLWGTWYIGIGVFSVTFLFARIFDHFTRTKGERKGYIKTDRKTARELMGVERAYAKLSEEDRALYKGYLEGAYYGDATPLKVIEFFDHKLQEAHKFAAETPRYIDTMIEAELPKE